MTDSRKAVESLRFLSAKDTSEHLSRAAEALSGLVQAENQKDNTERLVASNINKIAQQETKLHELGAKIDRVGNDLADLQASSAKETKEILSAAASITEESDRKIQEARQAVFEAEEEHREASKKLSAINQEIDERKAVLAKMLASA